MPPSSLFSRPEEKFRNYRKKVGTKVSPAHLLRCPKRVHFSKNKKSHFPFFTTWADEGKSRE